MRSFRLFTSAFAHSAQAFSLMIFALILVLKVPMADALLIEIGNLSAAEEGRVNLEFSIPDSGSPFLQSIPYNLPLGESFVSEDIPELSIPGTTLTRYGLIPSGISGTRDEILSDGLTIVVGSTGAWDRLQLTFLGDINTTVIPEPASLLLLGSGLVGLVVLRRK